MELVLCLSQHHQDSHNHPIQKRQNHLQYHLNWIGIKVINITIINLRQFCTGSRSSLHHDGQLKIHIVCTCIQILTTYH